MGAPNLNPEDLKLFQEWKLPLPTREAHGTPEDIRSNLKRLTPRNWRLQGNKLIADTDFGPLINYISTDYILKGTDKDGLPILVKL